MLAPYLEALDHAAEDGVLVVQPGRRGGGDEELAMMHTKIE
jgi:hypothetical protein